MEELNFIIFILTRYHGNFIYYNFEEDISSNDYRFFEEIKKLAKDFLESGIDNEDEDITETTRKFLKIKFNK